MTKWLNRNDKKDEHIVCIIWKYEIILSSPRYNECNKLKTHSDKTSRLSNSHNLYNWSEKLCIYIYINYIIYTYKTWNKQK